MTKDIQLNHSYFRRFDEDDMTGSCLDSMAEGVEDAAVVIICYSSAYKASANCRQEAQYTFRIQKPVIPVRVQEKYRADGWLGFLLASELYFDMCTSDKLDENLPKLLKEIQLRLKSAGIAGPGPGTQPPIPAPSTEPLKPPPPLSQQQQKPSQMPEMPMVATPALPANGASIPARPAASPPASQANAQQMQQFPIPLPVAQNLPQPQATRPPPASPVQLLPVDGRCRAWDMCGRWGVEEVQNWLKREGLAHLQPSYRLSIDLLLRANEIIISNDEKK